jgi:branched-chain amino acid transport system permease protein
VSNVSASALQGLYLSLVSGISYGLIISLLAGGLSLIYGVMNNVNTSHGAFYMMGGFLTFFAVSSLHLPIIVSIIFAFAAAFGLGLVFLYALIPKNMWVSSDPDAQNIVMILFLALAQVLQQGAFILYGGGSIAVPRILFGNIAAPGNVFISYQTVISIAISLLSYLGLFIFLRDTKIGRAIRAFSQDRELAESMGVRVSTIALMSFGLGVSLAALSGSLLSSIYSITASTGWNELVIAFVIVTFGGIGSISGSFLGGLVYGIVYSITQYFLPAYSFVVALVLIYIVLVLKPTGILGEIIERA